MTKPAIGFIGLGLMGSAMVARLQEKGYRLTVIANRTRTQVDAAVARGADEAKSYRELAAASDIVMLCVDTSASVEACMRGENGIIAGLRPGTIVVDFGTSLPASTRALGAEIEAAGANMLDAPLGRTPAHAREGKLNIMAAGDRVVWERADRRKMSANVSLGARPPGEAAEQFPRRRRRTCRIFAAADLAGVDRRQVYNVISAGPLH